MLTEEAVVLTASKVRHIAEGHFLKPTTAKRLESAYQRLVALIEVVNSGALEWVGLAPGVWVAACVVQPVFGNGMLTGECNWSIAVASARRGRMIMSEGGMRQKREESKRPATREWRRRRASSTYVRSRGGALV